MIEIPSFLRSEITLSNLSVSEIVRLDVGSSMIMIFASLDKALAISTSCCWPIDSFDTGVLGEMSNPNISRNGFVLSSIICFCMSPILLGSLPRKTFAPTSRLSNMLSS